MIKGDGRKRVWLAMDVMYYGADLGRGLRERFGVVGLTVFDAFLRACKRSLNEGEVSYISDADFLSIIGLEGLDLRDEKGVPWSLDDFWTYLGRMKNVRRTHSGRITHVRSTRWERWQNSRSRATNAGPLPTNSERDMASDKTGQDTDIEKDTDTDSYAHIEVPDEVWLLFATRELDGRSGQDPIRSKVRWLQGTQRTAREEHGDRARQLLAEYDLTASELVDVLRSDSPPRWLRDMRRQEA